VVSPANGIKRMVSRPPAIEAAGIVYLTPKSQRGGSTQTGLLGVGGGQLPACQVPAAPWLYSCGACSDLGSDVEPISSIRYWGFGEVDPGGEHHTLAEFTLNTDFNDFDWYNLSHVDAHNLPMQIVPLDKDDCRTLTCADSLLEGCPEAGKVRDQQGNVISCYSLDRDDPNSEVALYFEGSCKDAYSWSGDDAESMAACAGEDFAIVFCPAE
jgi:hypothetical protein